MIGCIFVCLLVHLFGTIDVLSSSLSACTRVCTCTGAFMCVGNNTVHSLVLCLSPWEIAGPRSHLLQSNICLSMLTQFIFLFFLFSAHPITSKWNTHTCWNAYTPTLVYCAGGVNTFYDRHRCSFPMDVTLFNPSYTILLAQTRTHTHTQTLNNHTISEWNGSIYLMQIFRQKDAVISYDIISYTGVITLCKTVYIYFMMMS